MTKPFVGWFETTGRDGDDEMGEHDASGGAGNSAL